MLSNVNRLNNRISYREIDPSFFVVVVDLWSENGTEERARVLNHTPKEKPQRDKKRQATLDSRSESVIYTLPSIGPKKFNGSSRLPAQLPVHPHQFTIKLSTTAYSLP
jgi:hypothetical protein